MKNPVEGRLQNNSMSRKTQIGPIDCKIDRQSFVPIYQQIKTWLLDKIRLGHLSNGDVVPSEALFCEKLSVSRGPVRQALYELRLEGHVIREKGRGTFIQKPANRGVIVFPVLISTSISSSDEGTIR